MSSLDFVGLSIEASPSVALSCRLRTYSGAFGSSLPCDSARNGQVVNWETGRMKKKKQILRVACQKYTTNPTTTTAKAGK